MHNHRCTIPFTGVCKADCRNRPGLLLITLLFMALGASGCADNQGNHGQQGLPPMPVAVLAVEPQEIAVMGEYAARVHGSREVEVRSRVAGILEQRLYTEGQAVREGAPLFQIDSEPFAIALQRAQAEHAAAAADLEQAQREARRSVTLYEQNAISQRERDQALTSRQLAEARLALAEASLADARRNLRYARVTAPIAGITGLEALPEGSLIEPGTLLTTITRHDPIHLRFSLPEADAARLVRLITAKAEQAPPLQATLRLADGTAYRHPGQVDFTDRVIAPHTGTVSARALFANPDGELIPGQLLRVRLQLEQLTGVFLVPPAAVGDDRDGPRVFIVEADNTVRSRPVILGPIADGRQIILSGLKAGDRLVINGQVALADGRPVNPIPAAREE